MAAHEQPSKSDEWYTPKYIFDALECTFDMDVAAPIDRTYCHVPATEFITENTLEIQWQGFVWMNPPYLGRNQKTPLLDKIAKHGNGIALLPDRTSAPWWARAAKQADAILFITPGKVKFIQPNGKTGDSPSNGTTLFAYGEKAIYALRTAQENGLGIMFQQYIK